MNRVTVDDLARTVGQRGALKIGDLRIPIVVTMLDDISNPAVLAVEIGVATTGEPSRVPTAISHRRQRAREAALDETAWRLASNDEVDMIAAAIEVATQVRITPELLDIFGRAWHEADEQGTHVPGARRAAGLRAAFGAAGFEVEQ